MYTFPHQVKAVGVVGKATKLYSIDLTAVHLNHPDRYGQPLALQWKWRPVPIGSFCTAGALLGAAGVGVESGHHCDRAAKDAAGMRSTTNHNNTLRSSQQVKRGSAATTAVTDSDDSSHFFRVGSNYTTMWEVRVVYNHQELYVQREAIDASSAVTRKVLERFPTWASCSLILEDLPLKATIEVFAICMDPSVDTSDAYAQRGRTQHLVGFQGVDLQLSPVPVPPSDLYRLGGDDPGFSPEINNLLSRCDGLVGSALQQQYPALSGMQILRQLRFASKGNLATAVLSWKSKLTSSFAGFKSSMAAAANKRASGSEDKPPNHLSLGYSWAVHVLSPDGGERVAAEGVCVGGTEGIEGTEGIGDTTGGGGGSGAKDASESKLRAWLWRGCSAEVPGLRQGDWVLLVGKPLSQQPNYPAATLASCTVGVQDCGLFSVHPQLPSDKQQPHGGGDSDEQQQQAAKTLEQAGVVCDSAEALLFAWHDDPRLQLPF